MADAVFLAAFLTGEAVALATKDAVRRVGATLRAIAAFLELFFLVECLPGCVVIAPSENGTAATANTVRTLAIAWRLRCK